MSKQDQQEVDAQKVRELYASINKEQPSAELDARILKVAHESHKQENSVPIKHDKRAWYMPVAYAAVIIVCFSVVMKLVLEPEANFQEPELDLLPVIDEAAEPVMVFEEEQQEDIQASKVMSAPAKRKINEANEAAEKIAPMSESIQRVQPQVSQAVSASAQKKMRIKQQEKKANVVKQESLGRQDRHYKDNKQSTGMSQDDRMSSFGLVGGALMAERENAEKLSAQDWVQKMQGLLDKKAFVQLEKELIQFRQYYPDYELPENLAEIEDKSYKSN